jgi:hypothetical protein
MSGGKWNYVQHRLSEVYEDMERWVENNGSQQRDDWDDLMYDNYSPDAVRAILLAAKLTRLAQKAIHRVDHLHCGDDGEESFLKKWEKEIGSIQDIEVFLKEGEK